MQITAQMVSQLREQTGAGMMECKKALVEAEGDLEKARDLLRLRGQAGAAKREGRAAADGIVAVATGKAGVAMIELNSETDFVARNEDFRALGAKIAQVAADTGITEPDKLLASVTDDGQPLKQVFDDVVAKLRENIVLRRAVCYPADASVVASYVHTVTNKIGVLLELEGDPGDEKAATLARNVAMHVAASKPEYLSRGDVPEMAVEHEKQVLTELTRNEGKPEAAIPKIVEGRLGKFYERICLLEQPYVRDPSKRVGELLKEAGTEPVRFALFVVGQS
jgi:elongation factor Ts